MVKDVFAKWLDEQFRDAHSSARELLGTNQRRQKSYYWKKIHGEPYANDDKVWVWSQETSKSKKYFGLWEGPYVVMARLSEVKYKLSKVSNPSKVKFLHFDMLKRCDEGTLQTGSYFKEATDTISVCELLQGSGNAHRRRGNLGKQSGGIQP